MRRRLQVFGCGAALLATAAGCNDNDFGIERRHPNRAPETVLASGPPDSTYATGYRVHLYWSGSDPDGTIDHYDFILVDHPAYAESIATGDSTASHRVVVRVPEVDDPRWTATTTNDTLIVTRADTLRTDPAPPPNTDVPSHNEFVLRRSFERWHTFFVRSVDNEGRPDPTPDYRSFNSRTLAPTVELVEPVDEGDDEFRAPPTIVFRWDGADEVGDGTTQAPIAARWTIIPSDKDPYGNYRGLPDALYRLPPAAWSRWRAWEASDRSGRRAIVRDLPRDARGVGFYIFAVQAMDEAGAVTPVFDWRTRARNNAVPVFVSGDVGPTLTLREQFLGTFNFTGSARPVTVDIAAGQSVHFTWRGSALHYGGDIVGYRYGWNIRDPSDEMSWDQNWSETATSAPTRAFTSGTHVFFLETRDNAESITRARVELTVRQMTRQRDLLLVDDSIHPQADLDPNEDAEDQRWLAVIDSLRIRRPFIFDAARDVYDVSRHNYISPPLSLVFDYKTVVWTLIATSNGSALGNVAMFFDPFVEGQNTVRGFNYLNLYLDNGGEMWVSGQQPTFAVWPVQSEQYRDPLVPVNITNWNLTVHPDEDSVGVNSLLYRMGVETMDLGSGGIPLPPRRDRMEQGCIGLRRATGSAYATQTYRSTLALEHVHVLVVRTADVDAPPTAGIVDSTEIEAADHAHDVTLTATELRGLARGERVTATTSESATPSPHAHAFEIADQLGHWGGPLFLAPDPITWSWPGADVNPYRSRTNVEIYNMPSWTAQQRPALDPPSDRVLPVYTFASATPADPEAGVLYPRTADGEPALLLVRGRGGPQYSRAWCGFEPWRLAIGSHVRLAEFLLLRHMRLGLAGSP